MKGFKGLKVAGHELGMSGTHLVSPFGASVWGIRLGLRSGCSLREMDPGSIWGYRWRGVTKIKHDGRPFSFTMHASLTQKNAQRLHH